MLFGWGRKKVYRKLLFAEALHIDPIRDWYSLVQFISLDRKKKLKGKALLAQWFYRMETMLRFFYKDITGEQLSPPDGHGWKDRFYGKGVDERDLEFLEYLTNQYHLNPRPKLILVVEGESEYDQLPRIAEAMGYPFERLGIRLELLGGIDEFAGKKKDREGGGKLTRFIDFHHHLQTVVYVILDNENAAHKVREKLLHARSRYPDSHRFVTKGDYVFLWERNFEFDNFSDLEIADALSILVTAPRLFSETDIRTRRENFGKPGYQIEKLFRSKTNRGLNKRQLAKHLTELVVEKLGKSRTYEPPKMVAKLWEITKLAATNYQPSRRETWLENQQSGFLAPVATK